MERIVRIELTSVGWKPSIIAVIRYPLNLEQSERFDTPIPPVGNRGSYLDELYLHKVEKMVRI